MIENLHSSVFKLKVFLIQNQNSKEEINKRLISTYVWKAEQTEILLSNEGRTFESLEVSDLLFYEMVKGKD